MTFRKTTTVLLALALAAVPAFAKKDKDKPKADSPAAAPQAAAASAGDSKPVATVAGQTITLDDVDAAASSQLQRIRQQEYTIRMESLQGLIQQKLITAEAAARKVSEADLLKTEVVDKSAAASPDDVQKFYDTNKARMQNKSFDETKDNIQTMLNQQKQSERRSQFLTELSQKADVKILLDPPRVAVKVPTTAPAIGSATAPITIVEWSDYQCPFCRRAHPTVEQVLNEYKDKVRFVYRDYPLPFHQQAMPASEAVHCAEDQGKFWEYHRNLFEVQGDLSQADLSKRATDIGLDATAFSACVQSKKHDPDIQSAASDGAAAGVTGTPAFFINGRMLVGAQPIEQFRDIINDELSRRGIAVPPAPPASAAAAHGSN
jgi:protein-disulfide isomerase